MKGLRFLPLNSGVKAWTRPGAGPRLRGVAAGIVLDAAIAVTGDRVAYAEVLVRFIQRGSQRRESDRELNGPAGVFPILGANVHILLSMRTHVVDGALDAAILVNEPPLEQFSKHIERDVHGNNH